jgi:hypothetical protein
MATNYYLFTIKFLQLPVNLPLLGTIIVFRFLFLNTIDENMVELSYISLFRRELQCSCPYMSRSLDYSISALRPLAVRDARPPRSASDSQTIATLRTAWHSAECVLALPDIAVNFDDKSDACGTHYEFQSTACWKNLR